MSKANKLLEELNLLESKDLGVLSDDREDDQIIFTFSQDLPKLQTEAAKAAKEELGDNFDIDEDIDEQIDKLFQKFGYMDEAGVGDSYHMEVIVNKTNLRKLFNLIKRKTTSPEGLIILESPFDYVIEHEEEEWEETVTEMAQSKLFDFILYNSDELEGFGDEVKFQDWAGFVKAVLADHKRKNQ